MTEYVKTLGEAVERKWLVPLAVFVLVAFLSVSPLVFSDGWPINDEFRRFLAITQIYSEHLARGDLLPLWSSYDAGGFGSPLPFYYHKVFYYVSGFLALFLSLKSSVLLALGIFAVVGQLGMYKVLERHVDRVPAIALAACLPLSLYAMNNWLVRGAMAEFSFMMIFPWFLLLILKQWDADRMSLWVAPVWLLLFFAHNMMAIVALAFFFVAWARAVVRSDDRRLFVKGSLVNIAVVSAALLPWLYVYSRFASDYDPGALITTNPMFWTQNNASNPLFSSGHWFAMVVDGGVIRYQSLNLTLLVAATVLLLWKRQIPLKGLAGFVALSVGVLLFAQSAVASPLWAHFSPGDMIQFPWRLQSLTVAFAIVAIALLLRSLRVAPIVVGTIAVLVFVGVLVESPVGSKPVYRDAATGKEYAKHTFPLETINAPLDSDAMTSATWAVGEYFPVTHNAEGVRLEAGDVFALYEAQSLGGPCTFERVTPRRETSAVVFKSNCAEAGTHAIPQNYSWLTSVRVDGKEVPAEPGHNDGIVRVPLPRGTSTVVSLQPTVWSILGF